MFDVGWHLNGDGIKHVRDPLAANRRQDSPSGWDGPG